MTPLSRAVTIAVQAHDGQVDKSGQPYVLHPLRVMLAMDTEDERIVAVLHDVIEDGPPGIVESIFEAGISDLALFAIYALTRRPSEPYADYIERCATSYAIATRVKLAETTILVAALRVASFDVPGKLDRRHWSAR